MGAVGALRGYKDTFGPMKIIAISYWGIGLPVGVVLSITSIITEPMGASGNVGWYMLRLMCCSYINGA